MLPEMTAKQLMTNIMTLPVCLMTNVMPSDCHGVPELSILKAES